MYTTEERNKAEASRMAALANSYGVNDSTSDVKLIHAYTELIDIMCGDEEERGREPDSTALINVCLTLPSLCKLNGNRLFELDISGDGAISVVLYMRWKAGIVLYFNSDGSVSVVKTVDRSSGHTRVSDIKNLADNQFLLDALAEYHAFDTLEPEEDKSKELRRYYRDCFADGLWVNNATQEL